MTPDKNDKSLLAELSEMPTGPEVMELMRIYHQESEKILTSLINKRIRADIKNGVGPRQLLLFAQPSNEDKKNSINNYLITISFKSGVTPPAVAQSLERALRKIYIKKVICVSHEQRGKVVKDMGTGYHIHILIEITKRKPSQLIEDFHSTFKNFIEGKNYVDVKKITNNIENVEQYLQGLKKGDSKQYAVAIDKKFKAKYKVS
jgi:hypothetical protein